MIRLIFIVIFLSTAASRRGVVASTQRPFRYRSQETSERKNFANRRR